MLELGDMSTLSELPALVNDSNLTNLLSGLGLLEFLTLCEDLVTTPIMGVWAGD